MCASPPPPPFPCASSPCAPTHRLTTVTSNSSVVRSTSDCSLPLLLSLWGSDLSPRRPPTVAALSVEALRPNFTSPTSSRFSPSFLIFPLPNYIYLQEQVKSLFPKDDSGLHHRRKLFISSCCELSVPKVRLCPIMRKTSESGDIGRLENDDRRAMTMMRNHITKVEVEAERPAW